MLAGQAATSWDTCREYVRIDSDVILGPASSVDIKYRPNHPAVCVEVGARSQIFGTLVVQRPSAHITVGERCQIGSSTIIAACGIDIGDDVMMAWGITLMDNDSHSISWSARQHDVEQCALDYQRTPEDIARNKDWSRVSMSPIRIGSRAWIGFGVIILKGVTVGEGAVIGAGSVVTSDVAPHTVVAGNPARLIRECNETDG